MQSNPELCTRIVELYNTTNPNNKIDDVKDLSYEQIAGMNLYDYKNNKGIDVIVPEFNLPMPKQGDSNIKETRLVSTQYATENQIQLLIL